MKAYYYLLIIFLLITSCYKNKVIQIDQELTDKYISVENELVAFRVNDNADNFTEEDFSSVIEKLGTPSNFSIYDIDENGNLRKPITEVGFNSVKINANLVKGQQYLAIKPISSQIKARYELIGTLNKIPNLEIFPEICHLILCNPDFFQFNDLAQEFPQLRPFEKDVLLAFGNKKFFPSPLVPPGNVCDACLGNNPIVLDFDNLLTIPDGELVNEPIDDCSLSDYDILKILYNVNLNNTLGWDLNDRSMLSWDGVYLKNGRIRSLNLIDKNLDVLPKEIGCLSNLNRLRAANNNLTNIPPEIGKLTDLTDLVLKANLIRTIPDELWNLKGLKYLSLSYNEIYNIPKEIGNLTSLKDLSLSGNNLESIPKEIGNLKDLNTLLLSSNKLTTIPIEIGLLTDLLDLFLSHNQLSSIPEELGNLKELLQLLLMNNELTQIPSSLGNLNKLLYLDLVINPVTKIPLTVCNLQSSGTNIRLDDGRNSAYPKDICE